MSSCNRQETHRSLIRWSEPIARLEIWYRSIRFRPRSCDKRCLGRSSCWCWGQTKECPDTGRTEVVWGIWSLCDLSRLDYSSPRVLRSWCFGVVTAIRYLWLSFWGIDRDIWRLCKHSWQSVKLKESLYQTANWIWHPRHLAQKLQNQTIRFVKSLLFLQWTDHNLS